jgi:hypothetical protein
VGVEYTDGSTGEWPATIVATDAQHDLAVLRIEAPPERLRPIRVRPPPPLFEANPQLHEDPSSLLPPLPAMPCPAGLPPQRLPSTTHSSEAMHGCFQAATAIVLI